MSIFPSCTILHKEQECDAPFYDSRHPLKVFVQDIFPLGELVCEAKAKGTWELSLLEYLWFIPGLPMQLLNYQEVTQRVALLLSSFPALWKSFQVTNKLLPASLHCIFLFLTCWASDVIQMLLHQDSYILWLSITAIITVIHVELQMCTALHVNKSGFS